MATCAISGNIPEEPVVSIKTGHLFERRLILKQIELSGLCPITQQPMTIADLIVVKTQAPTSKPRPPTATSFPSLLNSLQEEWDIVMLESFTLKQQVDSLKQELALSLYQQDASKRVIARVIRERDEARHALLTFQSNPSAAAPAAMTQVTMSDDTTSSTSESIPIDVVEVAKKTQEEIFTYRKTTRKERLANVESPATISTYQLQDSKTSPSFNSMIQGIATWENYSILGLENGQVIIYDTVSKSIIKTFDAAAIQNPSIIKNGVSISTYVNTSSIYFSVATSSTITHYECDKTFTNINVLSKSTSEHSILSVTTYPAGQYSVICDNVNTWKLYNMNTGACIYSLKSLIANTTSLTTATFHPDGQYLVLGHDNGAIAMIDLFTGQSPAQISCDASVTKIIVAETGFHIIVGTTHGIYLWDLRKMTKIGFVASSSNVLDISTDRSGTLCMDTGAYGTRVFNMKDLSPILTTDASVTAGAFATRASAIIVAKNDTIEILSAAN